MENKKQPQINISMPNLINICVDEKNNGEFSGRLYHCYGKEAEPFHNVVELLRKVEDLFDRICFPQASTKTARGKVAAYAGTRITLSTNPPPSGAA